MLTHSKESVLRINLFDVSMNIEDLYANYLIPETQGLYLLNQEKPTLVLGEQYYYYKKETVLDNYKEPVNVTESIATKVPLIDIYDVKNLDTIIYDVNGNEVLDTRRFKDTKNWYFKASTLPFTGFNLIRDILDSFVFKQLEYGSFPKSNTEDILERYIKFNPKTSKTEKRETTDFISERIDSIIREYKNIIIEFMNHDYYHEYEIDSNKSLDFILVKKQDFRIKEYYRLKAIVDKLTSSNG